MSVQLPLRLRLEDAARFEGYFAGPNSQAVNQLRACASGSGESQIYIWGRLGAGKTHLLHASCRACDERERTAVYLPMGEADGWAPEVFDGLEETDLVCLDDVQSVAGNRPWETALFGLFNRLRDAGNRLVVAADRPLVELGIELADLYSRLAWGLVYPLRSLSDEDRLGALQQRAAERGLELAPDTVRYLLRRQPRDNASLFRLLDYLDRESLVAQRKLTIPFVRSVLESDGFRNLTQGVCG